MKVRMLEFADSPEGRERFSLIYQGFVFGGNSTQARGIEVLRREARILDKMDEVSTETIENEVIRRVLKPGAQTLSLDQPQYELVKRYFEQAAWHTSAARKVVNTADWLASVPQTDEEQHG